MKQNVRIFILVSQSWGSFFKEKGSYWFIAQSCVFLCVCLCIGGWAKGIIIFGHIIGAKIVKLKGKKHWSIDGLVFLFLYGSHCWECS